MGHRISLIAGAFLASAAVGAEAGQQITIVNGTHFAVLSVQMKPRGGGDWQPDLLRQHTLGIGQIRQVGMPATSSCRADFLAVLSDGHKVLIPNANVCKNSALPVTDDRK